MVKRRKVRACRLSSLWRREIAKLNFLSIMVGDPPPRTQQIFNKTATQKNAWYGHISSLSEKLVRSLEFCKWKHRGKNKKEPITGSHRFKTEVRNNKTQVRKCKGYPEFRSLSGCIREICCLSFYF